MDLSERISEVFAMVDFPKPIVSWIGHWQEEAAQLEEKIIQLEADIAGRDLMDAEADEFLKGQELVPEGTLAQLTEARKEIVLLKAEVEGTSSVLLDVQQDCIKLREEVGQLRVVEARSDDC